MNKYIKNDEIQYTGTGFLTVENFLINTVVNEDGTETDVYGTKTISCPTDADFLAAGWELYVKSNKEIRDELLAAAEAYGSSDAVDSFIYGQTSMWIPSETRLKVYHSTTLKLASGVESTELAYDGVLYPFECATLLTLLGALELYADACYKVTQEHLIAIAALEDADLADYDYKTNYPEKLTV